MKYSVQQIANYLNGTIEGDPKLEINNIAKIEEAQPGDITFLANPIYTPHIYNTDASAVIVKNDFIPEKPIKPTLIKVPDPYQAFSTLLEFYNKTHDHKTGIEEPVKIDPTAQIGKDTYIGAFTYIGKNVKIGNNVKIFPNTYIGDDVTIGDHTIIFANVSIYHDTQIGNHVTIHSGTVIGADGFGFAPNNGNDFKKVPQIGNVIIEDHVEIGSNTSIDRATMGSTIIRRGVKLDNFIQIAHNVEVGENTVIAALTGVSGSTKIGKNCMIGGQVGVAGHLKIGDNVKIGAQSGISHSIKDGEIVVGTPALPIRNFKKSSILFKNLEDLYLRIQNLEKQLNNEK
jgi:UDP-3-O-[3-hydroxymyristoyl] glucosamine N-acyltransferase